jgi:RNA processing factor Prp31
LIDKRKLVDLLLGLDMEIYAVVERVRERVKLPELEAIVDILRDYEKAIVALTGAEEELYELAFSALDKPREEVVAALRESCEAALKYILEHDRSPSFDALFGGGGGEA